MLNNISNKINSDLKREQDQKDFYALIHEDTAYENFIDTRILNLNENGVNDKMLKNEMPFLFVEDTVVDDELITNLQNEVDYEDNFNRSNASDSDETTRLQEPEDFEDNFSTQYASDADADTKLNKEVDYSDNQKSPVNIDEFSNEAANYLFEMGDILGAIEVLGEAQECDGTNLVAHCPDEGDVIPQADEADVCDTEDPEGGLVEPVSESDEEAGEDVGEDDAVEEDFTMFEGFSLIESSDDEEDEDDDDDEPSDDDDGESFDDEEDELSDEEEDEDEAVSEALNMLDWLA